MLDAPQLKHLREELLALRDFLLDHGDPAALCEEFGNEIELADENAAPRRSKSAVRRWISR